MKNSIASYLRKNKLVFFKNSAIAYPNPVVNNHCSKLEINKWIISDFIVKELYPIVGAHPFPINELSLMTSVVNWVKPNLIVEWGTHIGKSARIFYEITKNFCIDCKIFSVDLPNNVKHLEHPKNRRGLFVRDIKEVRLVQGDGITEAIKIYKKVRKNEKALFLLDGNHSFKSVSRELYKLHKHVINPFILIHDTFYQSKQSNYNIGPYLAVKEFLKSNKDVYKIISTEYGLPGMTFLYQKKSL